MLRFFAICFFVLVVSAFNIKAQTGFRKGYVINKKRDTIWGQVDYRTNTKNYCSCVFKNVDIIEYFSEDIIGYGFVNDKFYSSGIVEGAFAEVLVVGDLSLYKCGSKYYLRKNDKIYVLERQAPKEVRVDGSYFLDEDNRWKGVFYFLLNDRIFDNSIVESIEFKEKVFVELVIKYNSLGQEKYKIFKESKPWYSTEIAVSGGLIHSSLGFYYDSEDRHDLKATYSSIGIVCDFLSPRVSEWLSFRSGLYYSRFKGSSQIDDDIRLNEYHKMKIDISSFTIPALVKFDLYKKDIVIYALGGVSIDYNFKADSKFFTEKVVNNTEYTSSGYDILDINKCRLGYSLGLGANGCLGHWKVGAVLGYSYMPNVDGNDSINANVNKMMFSVLIYL